MLQRGQRGAVDAGPCSIYCAYSYDSGQTVFRVRIQVSYTPFLCLAAACAL
jgi:hypothetical protein